MIRKLIAFSLLVAFIFQTCSPEKEKEPSGKQKLFELLPSTRTNITFSNKIVEGLNTNVLMYEYFYNGAGVAAGDLNNDGLEDLVFTSNMENNAFYLNMGDLKFKEVAEIAGITGRPGPWKTGITMADVNGDGLLDLYVSNSGKMAPQKMINQLFINQGPAKDGIPRFVEQTREYGLEFPTNTTHAVFFDFDNDGDLDLFILNHHPDSLPKLNEEDTENVLKIDDQQHGVRLLRNDNGYFTDITISAGIISSPITYGLGAGVVDINLDGWTDIYICNDFSLPDYLYVNNGDGTFTDKLQEMLGHTSYASMGNNVADINNDGYPDIFSLDMLPEDNRRQKLLLAPNDYDFFDLNIRLGFYYQYLRSMLHLNNGNGTFSEIGQIAGIAATDWSWSPLFADFDNDGWKDLLITNGYLRDYTNLDFLRNMNMYVQQNRQMKREDVLNLVNQMPETELHNYIYKNNENATFSQFNQNWGMTEGSYSNGAVYVDLDNDGDLDIVTNNINKPAFVYENKSNEISEYNFLKVKLNGAGKNTFGYGAKVYLFEAGQQQMLEQQPARGYQSSVSPILHFGLGQQDHIDSMKVIWQGGSIETISNVSINKTIELDQKEASDKFINLNAEKPIYKEIISPINFAHAINNINDFKRQALMLNAKSFEGPCMIQADVNGDGLADVFVGGGVGQVGAIFIQTQSGFRKQNFNAFNEDKASDDVDAIFFDANIDGHPDLYVCSGGYHNFQPGDSDLQDRLYLNDSEGKFIKSKLPTMLVSSGCVAANDVNSDGFQDLFVGGFVVPGQYPEIPRSAILINDGKGNFINKTTDYAPELERIGMVSDATWNDLEGDNSKELIVVGQWMPVTIYGKYGDKLINRTSDFFDRVYSGFWNKILVGDFNKDGRGDLVLGNLGLNSQLYASENEPANLHYKDFDNNGSLDPILSFFIQGKSYPYVTRKELITQIGRMEKRFPDFESYANATITEVFTDKEMKDVQHLQANHTHTTYFESAADGKFVEKSLPVEVQYAPVFTITSLDYNGDGNKDLLMCGNINHARIRFGKYDANYGLLLKGDGKGGFAAIPQHQSGFKLKGDVRSAVVIDDKIIFGTNQNKIKAYQLITQD